MKIIDITGIIEENMWTYGDPIGTPVIQEVASVDSPIGWQAHLIKLWTLTGTYLEANSHLFLNGKTIDQIAPNRFIRPACIFQLEESCPKHPITRDELFATGSVPDVGDAVLIATGWDRMWNKETYVIDSPYLTMDAMDWLVDTGASIIGGDFPTFDNHAQPSGVNYRLFSAGCLILAPLVNLRGCDLIKPHLIALPLKIKGVCGTPCRAILVDGF